MGTRSNDLTEVSKNLAEKLRLRIGSLKLVLSAGVVALSKLTAEDREEMVAEAQGITAEKPLCQPISDAADAIKHATVHYDMLGKEDKEVLDDLRRILGPESKPKKRKTKSG